MRAIHRPLLAVQTGTMDIIFVERHDMIYIMQNLPFQFFQYPRSLSGKSILPLQVDIYLSTSVIGSPNSFW